MDLSVDSEQMGEKLLLERIEVWLANNELTSGSQHGPIGHVILHPRQVLPTPLSNFG